MGLKRIRMAGGLALMATAVVLAIWLAPAGGQDPEMPPLAQPRETEVEPFIQQWADAVEAVTPVAIAGVPFPALSPQPVPGRDDAIALIRLPEPPPPEDDTEEHSDDDDVPTWPFVSRRPSAAMMRLMDDREVARLEAMLAIWSPTATLGILLADGQWHDLLTLGSAAGPFHVLADGRLLAVSSVRLDESAIDLEAGPQATLWLIDPRSRLADADAEILYTPLYTGREGLAVCLFARRRNLAIVADPVGADFSRRILAVSLVPDAEPTHLADGLWAECLTEDESGVVVARPVVAQAGDNPDEPFRGRRMINIPPGMAEDEAAYLRPFTHVTVDLRQRQETELLRGEALYRVVLFWRGQVYYEELVNMDRTPDRTMSPIVSQHFLWSFDPEEQTRVPLTGNDRRDDHILGVLPDLGVVYLHSTAFNRYVRLLTSDYHHLDLACISPFSEGFCFTPSGLTWLETQETTGDQWTRPWEDHARVMSLAWPERH